MMRQPRWMSIELTPRRLRGYRDAGSGGRGYFLPFSLTDFCASCLLRAAAA
jgi:hypothetical protein